MHSHYSHTIASDRHAARSVTRLVPPHGTIKPMCHCNITPDSGDDEDLDVACANEMQMVQDLFDQRPEDEVRDERITRLWNGTHRCHRCGVMIEAIEDGDVAMFHGYPRLIHRECPPAPVTADRHFANDLERAKATIRELFPDAVAYKRPRTLHVPED